MRVEQLEYRSHARVEALCAGADDKVGIGRRLVGATDAREVGDLASECALIQPLRIARDARFNRGLDIDLKEVVVADDAASSKMA